MKSKVKKLHSEAKMNLKDLSEQKKLIDAIEENGVSNWEAVSKTIDQPPQYCEAGFKILQKEMKREEIDHKKKILGTGGGPPPPDDDFENSPLKKLKKMIQPQVDGMHTIYDGDSELMAEFQLSLTAEERSEPIETNLRKMDDIILEVDLECQNNIPGNFGTPRLNRQDILKKKKDVALDVPRLTKKEDKQNCKKTCNDSFQALAEAKLELVHLQKEVILLDIEQKKKMYALELEERRKKSEFNDKMRKKNIHLLDLEIKKNI